MRRKRVAPLALLFCTFAFCVAQPASATPITFNFDSLTPGTAEPSVTEDGLTVHFEHIGPAAIVCSVSGYATLSGNAICSGSGYRVTSSSPVASVAFDYSTDGSDLDLVYYLSADLTDYQEIDLTPTLNGVSGFYEGEASLSGLGDIYALDITDNGDGPTVDNMSFTLTPTGATPEPSSIMLLGTGMLGCAGMVRRPVRRKPSIRIKK